MIDVYKIGVELSLVGNLAGGLQVLLRQFGVFNTRVTELNQNLAKVRELVVGLGMVAAGWEIGKGLVASVKAADDLYEKLLAIKQLGGDYATPEGQARTLAQVFDLQRLVPTSSAVDAASLLQHLAPIAHAGAAEPAAQMLLMAQAALKQSGISESEEDLSNLLRVIDLRGHMYNAAGQFDQTSFMAEVNAAVASIQMTGGLLKPNDMLQQVRQGGAAARAQSTEAFYGAGAEVGIGMGAGRTGTAETSLLSQLIGGIMPGRIALEMQRMGLLHEGEWHNAKGGGAGGGVITDPSVSERFSGALRDPEAFIQTTVIPALKAHGITTPDAIITEIFRLFGRQTAQRFVMDVINNAPQVQRGRDMLNISPDVAAKYKDIMDHSLTANIDAFNATWKTFEEAFGMAAVQPVVDTLKSLRGALAELTDLIVKHPEAAEWVFKFTAALSGLLVLGGAIRIAAVALGPFALGIRAIVGIPGLGTTAGILLAVAAGITALADALKIWPRWLLDPKGDFEAFKQEMLRKAFPGGVPPSTGPSTGAPGDYYPIPQSYHPPASAAPRVQTITYLQIDGRTLAHAVSEEQARYLDLPASGASRFDPKMGPSYVNDTLRV